MSEELNARDMNAPPAPEPIPYAAPVPKGPGKDYAGLKITGSILLGFAVVGYVSSVLLVTVGMVSILSAQSIGDVPAVYCCVAGVLMAMHSAMLHALSAACEALRDIAINSFKF